MCARRLLVAVALLALWPVAASADKAVKCTFKSLAACPKIGCSKPGSPLAVTNSQKRTTAINGSPTKISFTDLARLQADVKDKFSNPVVVKGAKVSSYHNMNAAPRKILLSELSTGSGPLSEGDFVELSGFIASQKKEPHPNKGESVNCKLTDDPSNDYHINLTPDKNQTEAQGVVVEMIPQDTHRKSEKWNLDKLKQIQEKQLQVKVQGRLFFDSEHSPNTNMTKKNGNPKRFSLWEIHPISSFFVCPAGSCSSSAGWKPLENWEPTP